ncbi:hypothetical protein [uncultured Methanolobus sp.]|uniref:hypothetical protein n=1 Tax=uncultured Methanolobus sp. TaxID=218300 RepID=UPI002AAC4A79|nr:hypothetical protein [uncultured Methanolobus sp.]
MSSECAVESIPAGYKQTELGVIPEDWEVKSIGDIVAISVGRDLKEEDLHNIEWANLKGITLEICSKFTDHIRDISMDSVT